MRMMRDRRPVSSCASSPLPYGAAVTGRACSKAGRTPARIAGPCVFVVFVTVLALFGAACQGAFGSEPARTPALVVTATNASTETPTSAPPIAAATPLPASTRPALPPNPSALQRWRAFPIRYCVASQEGYVTDAELMDAAARAFAAWGVPVDYTGVCDGTALDDDLNEIGWGTLNRGVATEGTSYEAGVTDTRYQRCTADCDPDDRVHTVEADITIDSAPPHEFRNTACLYATLLHETGHFLGIEHLPPPAVMAAETQDCLQQLTPADIDALRARYGAVAQPP